MNDIDIDKLKNGLKSKLIDLPQGQSVEERTIWLMQQMEMRKSRFSFDSKQATKLGDDMINHYVNIAQKGANDD